MPIVKLYAKIYSSVVCQTIAMAADMSVDLSESLMNSYTGYVLWCTYGFFCKSLHFSVTSTHHLTHLADGGMPFFYALVALFVE
jgi:hypothetical protein